MTEIAPLGHTAAHAPHAAQCETSTKAVLRFAIAQPPELIFVFFGILAFFLFAVCD